MALSHRGGPLRIPPDTTPAKVATSITAISYFQLKMSSAHGYSIVPFTYHLLVGHYDLPFYVGTNLHTALQPGEVKCLTIQLAA